MIIRGRRYFLSIWSNSIIIGREGRDKTVSFTVFLSREVARVMRNVTRGDHDIHVWGPFRWSSTRN